MAKFTLATRQEILQHLQTIVDARAVVTVFSGKGKSFILTALLAVDGKRGELVLDWGANEHANQMLLKSERNVFVCAPGGVKTQFSTGEAREVDFEGGRAFALPLPDKVIKLQRREFFRINTPLMHPLHCELRDHPDGPHSLPLFDISIGGVALTLQPSQQNWLASGQMYHDVRIELPPFGILQVELEICHIKRVQLTTGAELYRAGCLFRNMNMARESLVQRYIAHLERERRALVR